MAPSTDSNQRTAVIGDRCVLRIRACALTSDSSSSAWSNIGVSYATIGLPGPSVALVLKTVWRPSEPRHPSRLGWVLICWRRKRSAISTRRRKSSVLLRSPLPAEVLGDG